MLFCLLKSWEIAPVEGEFLVLIIFYFTFCPWYVIKSAYFPQACS